MLVTPDILRRLRGIIEPVAARVGCDVVAVEIVGGPSGRPILRVSIERLPAETEGVAGASAGIADCAALSRQLSPTLDVEDPIASAYEFEVSTPGIERPVQRVADFERFVGCEIRLKPFGVDARKRTRGILLGVQAGVVRVGVAAPGGHPAGAGPSNAATERHFPLDTIERANLALTLAQFQRLGKGLSPNPVESP